MLNRFTHSNLGWLAIAIALLIGLACPSPALATGVYQMPTTAPTDSSWVIDEAGVLSRLNEGKISNEFKQLARDTGSEVRLVTIHRLDYGETPESFAQELLAQWFPTSEAQENQAILVLDDVTNGAALVAGAAVSEQLTAEIAESITAETIGIPLRKDSKYNQALVDASDRLVAVVSGQPDPGPPVDTVSYETEGTFATAEETEENRSNATVIVVGFLIAATIIPMATYYFYQSMGG